MLLGLKGKFLREMSNYKKLLAACIIGGVCASGSVYASAIPAFPGAEGGGKFTTGGRGCEVYHVTNLMDYKIGETPIPGSFRAGIKSNTTIVFDVAGTIEMVEPLRFGEVENITIAGQSAPGDGITLAGFETNISKAQNLIIRYLRFRPGSKNVHVGDGMDGLWGRQHKNVIIDHCSFSFSTDEGLSPYRGENMTVQWCIISESLTMSGHTKGRHGYGGIWGGVNTTFHHNLMADHTSRNPRIGGGTVEKDDNDHLGLLQLSNNVIYNWGFNTCYGGGRAQTNFINNYEKAGPGTREEVLSRIIDAGEGKKPGYFYVNGNYIEGNEEYSLDNSKGIYISAAAQPFTTITDKPFEMSGTEKENLTVQSAVDCYEEVLAKSGATYPRRDAYDARIVAETRNGEGRYINTDHEVGGYPCLTEVKREDGFDSDGDGISDEWEKANGLNPNDAVDGSAVSSNGYTNLENYLNSLVDMNYRGANPEVKITGVKNNTYAYSGSTVKIGFSTKGESKIVKAVLFDGSKALSESSGSDFTYTVPEDNVSHFITVRVTDENGLSAQSSAVTIISVKKAKTLKGFKDCEIGSPNVKGTSFYKDDKLYVCGTGKLGRSEGAVKGSSFDNAKTDDCHFVYKMLKGDFKISCKLDSVTAVDNHAFAGLMIRNSLKDDSADVVAGLSWVKSTSYKENGVTLYRNPWSIYIAGRNKDGENMNSLTESLDSKEAAAKAGVTLKDSIPFKDYDTPLGYFMSIERRGNTVTAFISCDGVIWEELGKREASLNEKVYAGFAVDGNKVANRLDNVNTSVFSNIVIEEL